MVRPRIESPAAMHVDAIELPHAEPSARIGGSLRFLVEIALPWIGRRARSIALGCVVAVGGCGGGEHVELSGVVRDGRTGAPIARAQITTDDGRTIETDEDGRFSAIASESLVASAEGRCEARYERAERPAREITLRLYDRLELAREHTQVGFDAEVRIEVRTRCDADAELTWTQLAGPELGDRMRVEDAGRVLVVRTHSLEELAQLEQRPRRRGDYRFGVGGVLGDARVTREARVVAGGDFDEQRLTDRPRGGRAQLASRSRVVRPDEVVAHPSGAGWTHARNAELDTRCSTCHAAGGADDGGIDPIAARPGWDPRLRDAGLEEPTAEGSTWCSACHGHERGEPPSQSWLYSGADLAASHVALDEWRLTAMSGFPRERRQDDPALRRECAQCHSAQGFVAWQRGRAHEPDLDSATAITCAACHDPHDASRPHALRVFDTVDAIGGAPAEHLGSGALCASCHRGDVALAGDPSRAAHAPQADVMIGRGARLAPAMDAGAHRFIANTCVRCHMTRPAPSDPLRGRAGGHTFSIRARAGEPAISAAACTPCHGDEAPEAIGARDWDGDGTSGAIGEEHARALALASELFRARVARASIRDGCARLAADVIEHDARLHLVDAEGMLLGDCDASGRIEPSETPVTVSALPPRLADAAHDLALLRADGSGGVHNPEYAFRVLAALTRALR